MTRFLADRRVMRVARACAVILLVLTVVSNGFAVRVALDTQERERAGRHVALETTCAAIGAVVDAGRAAIQASATRMDGEFERNLRKLGYPPLAERRVAADLAAAAYARSIANRVQDLTGRTDLVRQDGSLDCKQLKREVTP